MANWIDSEFGLAALYTLIAEDVLLWGIFAALWLIRPASLPRGLGLFMFAVYGFGLLAGIAAFVGLFKDQQERAAVGAVVLAIVNTFICGLTLTPFFV